MVKLTIYRRQGAALPDHELRARGQPGQRAQIIEQRTSAGLISSKWPCRLANRTPTPSTCCAISLNAPVLTRRQRADRVKKQQAVLRLLRSEAHESRNDLLEKYATDGELGHAADVLKSGPIHMATAEIIGKFGGADQLQCRQPTPVAAVCC